MIISSIFSGFDFLLLQNAATSQARHNKGQCTRASVASVDSLDALSTLQFIRFTTLSLDELIQLVELTICGLFELQIFVPFLG